MTDAETVHAQVTAALAKLGARHGIGATDDAPELTARPTSSRMPRSAPRAIPTLPSAPTRGREAVTREQRALEGLYADVIFRDEGAVTVLIHSVELRTTGVKAYVMRLDKRTREYITLDRLHSLRDTE